MPDDELHDELQRVLGGLPASSLTQAEMDFVVGGADDLDGRAFMADVLEEARSLGLPPSGGEQIA